MVEVDLSQYRDKGVRVFSGRPRGEAVREKTELDAWDKTDVEIEVKVPMDILSFNTSFFLGLFGPSVRAAGSREAFIEKFKFSCKPLFWDNINEGIERALNEKRPLSQ